MASGYSGTPLAKKLGFKTPGRVLLIDAPPEYPTLFATLPDGIVFVTEADQDVDLAHVFVTAQTLLIAYLATLRTQLRSDVAVWISWPKKASRVPTDVTEDSIREAALPLGWVDVKVCAVSEVWSGLKLVVRKELR